MSDNPLQKKIQNEAYRIVLLQLTAVAIIALTASLIKGAHTGYAVLLGGLAYGLPNLFFVFRVFRYAGAREMTKFVAAFFLGEALKLILSAILFLVIVKTLPVSLLSTLVGFFGAIISFWIVCIWHFSRQQQR